MAIANDNVITRMLHGRIGNVIFRKVGKKTIASKAHDYSKHKWTKAQIENRKRFGKASLKVNKKLRDDPELKNKYKKLAKGNQNANNVAMSDYLKPPEITEINVKNYKGQKGNTIRVGAKDKYFIAGVIVMILNAQGIEVESGMAVEIPFSGSGVWVYKSMEDNPCWKGGRVVVRVADLPGNVVTGVLALDGT